MIKRILQYRLPTKDFKVLTKIRKQSIYIPSRTEILKQLGISPEEDEQNQIKWSKL